ncbi:double-strand break repair helicase AddA [Pelagibacterium montanilacus]|uniref:double-strand break repair helicase AddA n=1 Tax=Pelagibacterium montanilacus TaxID=2185280 RepID=UPI0013DF0AFD|nr:double-strand break repair helicase AddA [Pelagibacterium montanilacus]
MSAGRTDRREVKVPDDLRATQAAVSAPENSAWVSANAGSGKTFVLTRRVLRLLLSGVRPESILCLTYTKAAAAEMRQRVGAELARWALAEDGDLASILAETTGRPAQPEDIVRARTLFAHALETPGGLKIQTIHAFCEAVLQRFPYEAGVPVDFSVIEEDERERLMREARETVLAEGLRGDAASRTAVSYLFTHFSDAQIETAIAQGLAGGRALDAALADPGRAMASLRGFLGLGAGETEETIRAGIVGDMLVPVSDYPAILSICPPDPDKTRFEDKIARIDPEAPDPDAVLAAYLTDKGQVPKAFPKKAFGAADPALADRLAREADRLAGLVDRLKAAGIAERSGALLVVLGAILQRFETAKRARSLLDFDDLIARTNGLFGNRDVRDWVRYKLDAGIDHILVDESQDTNRAQWQVIDTLAEDFYAGDGVARRPRTLFAVGDPKQSIYSFQGAEPELFIDKGRHYAAAARNAGARFEQRALKASFRTLGGLLGAVDAVAARPDIAAGLLAGGEPITHVSARTEEGGAVEIWPLTQDPAAPAPGEDWPVLPPEALESAPRRLARKIVGQIARWLESGTPLAGRGRAIRAEDILILVQTRNKAFVEIVAALRRAGIASPGADKLPVSAHIVVDDLLGLADALANPTDDLMVAAVLRSPFFDLSEDELYAVAAGRADGRSVFSALAEAESAAARRAHERLDALRRTLDIDRPYGFFAHLLYAQGGLKALRQRLGAEVDEIVAEFLELALAHETSDQPSLTGFVARMRTLSVTVKRDLAERSAGVRVMTVHGAKGLESPIVILADAAGVPPSVKRQVFFEAPGRGAPFMLYCGGDKDRHSTASAPLREREAERQQAEYWRNLYVGMTRAEDLLIVAGHTTRGADKSWHSAISAALAPTARPETRGEETVLVHGSLPHSPIAADGTAMDVEPVEHAHAEPAPMAIAPAPELLAPSRYDTDTGDGGLARAGESLVDAETARVRGIALHALLEHLAKTPEALREGLAHDAALQFLPEHTELAAPLAREALAVLAAPSLAPVFGPSSRAEVAFSLKGMRGERAIVLSGRFDRIVVDQHGVLVVDFKSDAVPPATQEAMPQGYRAQMALYFKAAQRLFPDRAVRVAIVWTATGAMSEMDTRELTALAADIALA